MRSAALSLVVFSAAIAFSQEPAAKAKPRVFVPDSQSWSSSSAFGRHGGSSSGGARPQTAEIIKTVGEKCPGATVTMKEERADYVLLLEHEGGKSIFSKKNKFSVFNKEGDSIKSGSTTNLGHAVEDACGALMQDWAAQPVAPPAPAAAAAPAPSPAASPSPPL
jgi:hypothetical protein